jgi:general secretion pathway protein D
MRENMNWRRLARNLPLLTGVLTLSACELIGPRVDENPIRLPKNQSETQAETGVPEPVGDLAATTSRMTEAELFASRAAQVAPAPKKKPAPEEEGKYSLNFDDADLGEVAKVILGESLKKNYVISPKVSGRVTLRTSHPLTEQELAPTLEMLLHMNGAVLIEDKGGYLIEPDSEGLARGRLGGVSGYRFQVIPLKYVGSQEMQTILEPIMPPKSVIKADPVRNLLFLAGSGDDLERVIETVQVFDVNFLKGMSFGLYPLKNVAVNTIFGELQALFGEGASGPLAGVIRLFPVERLNAVMAITAQPGYLEDMKVWVERLDRSNAAGGGNMHVYRVQHVDAIQLAQTLSQVFGGGMGGFGAAGGLAPGLRPTLLSGSGGSNDGMSGTGGRGVAGQGSSRTGLSGGTTMSSSTTSGTGSSSAGGGSTAMGGFGGIGGASASSGLPTSGGLGASRGNGAGTGGGGDGMGGMGGQSGQGDNAIRITADPANNALVILAPPFEYESIEKLIKELDVMPLQVLVDAMIVEISLTDELEYGVQWLFKHGEGKAAGGGTITDAAAAVASNGIAPGGFGYSLIAKNVQASLEALAKKSKINVLSAPSLMVMNNQQAVIKVGDQVPIRTSESTNTNSLTQGGGATGPNALVTSTIQMRDTGVQLMLRPRVNKGGLVTMDILQQVDDVKETDSSNIDSPTIAQRQIQSSIAVKDGDTIVLGGLIKENRTKSSTGLPLLSDLPLIGPLFGSNSRKQDRTELIVLITPHVAEDRSEAISVTEEYKARLKGFFDGVPAPSVAP